MSLLFTILGLFIIGYKLFRLFKLKDEIELLKKMNKALENELELGSFFVRDGGYWSNRSFMAILYIIWLVLLWYQAGFSVFCIYIIFLIVNAQIIKGLQLKEKSSIITKTIVHTILIISSIIKF